MARITPDYTRREHSPAPTGDQVSAIFVHVEVLRGGQRVAEYWLQPSGSRSRQTNFDVQAGDVVRHRIRPNATGELAIQAPTVTVEGSSTILDWLYEREAT